MHFINSALDFIFSSACPLCKSSSRRALLCHACATTLLCETLNETREHELQQACLACGTYAYIYDNAAQLCFFCAENPLPLRKLRSIWEYAGIAEEALKYLKYGSARGLVRSLTMLAAPFVANDPFFLNGNWDFIVPIPSARSRILSREFSHTGLLAQAFGRLLKVPVHYDLLLPNADRSPQAAHQTAKARAKNIRGAFKAGPQAAGKTLLLIDDILTSGATLSEAAKVLLAAGSQAVDGFTLARSAHFTRHRAEN